MRNRESVDLEKILLSRYKITEILDLGAGRNPHNQIRLSLGIKQFLVDLVEIPNQNFQTSVIKASVLDESLIEEQLFLKRGIRSRIDCVASLHCIEHLQKEDGIKLLDMMERLSGKLVIIETPNGFVHQSPTRDNPWQEHLSGWTINDFRSRGFKVRGISGMKFLHKNSEKGAYKWPLPGMRIVDLFLSRLLNLNYFPSLSFNLIAWKVFSQK
jgi:hypothetical protein